MACLLGSMYGLSLANASLTPSVDHCMEGDTNHLVCYDS